VCYYRRSGTLDRSSVTELPGLTSDPIYTADRRGGILISFGRNRTLAEGINPSRCPACRPTVRPRGVPEATTFAFNPKCPVSLKGIGSVVAETAWRRRVPAPSVPSAWYLMAGVRERDHRAVPGRRVAVKSMGTPGINSSNRLGSGRESHARVSRGRRAADHPTLRACGLAGWAPRTRTEGCRGVRPTGSKLAGGTAPRRQRAVGRWAPRSPLGARRPVSRRCPW